MPTIIVPLQDIVTDPQNPIDLTALPEADVAEKIRGIYGFLGPLIEVQVREGVAVITLPEEQERKANQALEKIEQAAKAAKNGRYQQALTLYHDALKVLPTHTTSRRDLAMVEMEMGRTAAAKQDLIRVLQLEPNDAWAYTILGNLYFRHEKDLGSAERYYATAAELAPDDTYVLSSYGGLLAERGKYAEAEAVLRRAIAADPKHINPRLGLAMVQARLGQTDAAIAELEALFAQPADSDAAADARSQPVYAEARRLYRELRRQRGVSRQAEASEQLRAALEEYTEQTGIDIHIEQDANIDTTAKVELAWRYNRPYHAIRLARGGASAYTIAHEFEHIGMEAEARAAGVNRLFAVNQETTERGQRAIEKDLRKLRNRGLSEEAVGQYARQIVQGLAYQLYSLPLDCFIETRVHADFPALDDVQFIGLAQQMERNEQAVLDPQVRQSTPPRVLQASAAMNAALALFVDDLYGGVTAYAEVYQPTGMLATGRKLYQLFRKMSQGGRPGVEYDVVDAWADELNLRHWYVWRNDTAPDPAGSGEPAGSTEPSRPGAARRAPEPAEDDDLEDVGHRPPGHGAAIREGGATNPEYLAQPMVQMAAMMHMTGALERFEDMERDEIFAVGTEIAILGMNGINYVAGEEQYTLEALPDETFSGLQLLCLEYVAFKLTAPEIDLKLPLDDAYQMARTMYGGGKQE